MKDIEKLMAGARYIMFINPGAVKLRNVAFCSASPEVLYQSDKPPSETKEGEPEKSSNKSQESDNVTIQQSRPSSITNFVKNGISSMQNGLNQSNYNLDRYLKKQQMLVPTM